MRQNRRNCDLEMSHNILPINSPTHVKRLIDNHLRLTTGLARRVLDCEALSHNIHASPSALESS
jgi:hypothetical protein